MVSRNSVSDWAIGSESSILNVTRIPPWYQVEGCGLPNS